MSITNVTINASSGDGLRRDSGALKLRNSIIASSSGADCAGTLAENDSNYIEDDSCSPALSNADGAINLGALTGSPAYHPLGVGSPAIDAGSSSHCPDEDQAGTARPVGAGCDIGAHERAAPPTATPSFTATLTATATESPTATLTATVTVTPSDTPTVTPTRDPHAPQLQQLAPVQDPVNDDPSETPTATATDTALPTATVTKSATATEPASPTATNTATVTATASATDTPTATETASATAEPTATSTATATASPRAGCVQVGPGAFWLFPSASSFLSGLIHVYSSDQCEAAGASTQQIGADGFVYTGDGATIAKALCEVGHGGSRAFNVRQQVFNGQLWACQPIPPTATNTALPPSSTPIPPTATDTAIPPTATDTTAPPTATDTPVPPTATHTTIPPTLADARAIAVVRATSARPGELDVSWDAPRETVRDYRIRWAKVGENYRTWTDLNYNAFPTTTRYTITGLEEGARYKILVRARFKRRVGTLGAGSKGGCDGAGIAAAGRSGRTVQHTNSAIEYAHPDVHADSTFEHAHPNEYVHSVEYAGSALEHAHPNEYVHSVEYAGSALEHARPAKQHAAAIRGTARDRSRPAAGRSQGRLRCHLDRAIRDALRLSHRLGARRRGVPQLARRERQCLSDRQRLHGYGTGCERLLQIPRAGALQRLGRRLDRSQGQHQRRLLAVSRTAASGCASTG